MLQGGQEEDCWERVQIYTDRTPFISEACSLSLTMWQMSSTESVSSCCPPCLRSTEGHPLQGLPAEGFPPAWENTVVRSGKNLLENQKGKTSGGRMSSWTFSPVFIFFPKDGKHLVALAVLRSFLIPLLLHGLCDPQHAFLSGMVVKR